MLVYFCWKFIFEDVNLLVCFLWLFNNPFFLKLGQLDLTSESNFVFSRHVSVSLNNVSCHFLLLPSDSPCTPPFISSSYSQLCILFHAASYYWNSLPVCAAKSSLPLSALANLFLTAIISKLFTWLILSLCAFYPVFVVLDHVFYVRDDILQDKEYICHCFEVYCLH